MAGNGWQASMDGWGVTSSTNSPYGVASDYLGNVYWSEAGGNFLRKLSVTGYVSTIAGDGLRGFRAGDGTNSRFNSPQGIAVDDALTIYSAEFSNHMIRTVASNGSTDVLVGGGGAVRGMALAPPPACAPQMAFALTTSAPFTLATLATIM